MHVCRPDSLPCKSEVSAVDGKQASSARTSSHTRDSSPMSAHVRHKDLSHSGSSAESASSLTRIGSMYALPFSHLQTVLPNFMPVNMQKYFQVLLSV